MDIKKLIIEEIGLSNSSYERLIEVTERFLIKNRHKTQRKAKLYLNNWRSVFCMYGGLKQALA